MGGGVTEAIIKPVQDTSSGVGVEKIKGAESIKNNLQEKAKKKGTYIVQECIAQNERLAVLYAGAVNTFRVITYLWNGEVFHVPLALRIGQGGSYLDNAHAGGMFIGVNDSGELNDEAFTEFGKRYKEHPDTHAVFKGYKLSFATVYKGNIIKNLIMDCQSYTKYRPNETTGGIFVSWRRKEELPTGA